MHIFSECRLVLTLVFLLNILILYLRSERVNDFEI